MRGEPGTLFLFRLALAMGYPHPRYLARELTVNDIKDWLVYNNIEPFGDYQRDFMLSQIAAEVHNGAGYQTAHSAWDYMPGGKPAQTADQQMCVLRGLLGR